MNGEPKSLQLYKQLVYLSTFNNDMGLFNNDLPYTATIKGLPAVLISTSTYNTIAFVRIHKYILSIL